MTLEQAIELLKYRYIKFIDDSFEGVKEQREAVAILIEHAEQALRLGGELPKKKEIDTEVSIVKETCYGYNEYEKGYNQALDEVQAVLPAIVAEEVKKKILTRDEMLGLSAQAYCQHEHASKEVDSSLLTTIVDLILAKMREKGGE